MKATRATETESRPLGEILVAQGLITRAELDAALSFREDRGLKLGEALVALHLANPNEISTALRSQGRFHCVDLDPCMVDVEAARALGEVASRRLQAIALHRIGDVVTVAMEDPLDAFAVEAIEAQVRAPVFAVHASSNAIQRALDVVFPSGEAGRTPLTVGDVFESPGPAREALQTQLEAGTSGDLEERAARLLSAALDDARGAGASEVTFEPRHGDYVLRYRVDGVFESRGRLAADLGRAVAVRVRSHARGDFSVSAELDVALRTPAHESMRVRVALARLADGELVRCVLPQKPGELDALEKLGLASRDRNALGYALERGSGLFVVAGPPASGRSTTLQAAWSTLATSGRRTLARGLDAERCGADAALLDDHDDAEECARAVRASAADAVVLDDADRTGLCPMALDLSREGRLVLVSIAGGSSASALQRLARLCGEGRIENGLGGLLVQRLVRRLCPSCRKEARPAPSLVARFARRGDDGPYWESAGCTACGGRGIQGRIALFDVALGTQAIAAAREASEALPLSPSALALALAGEVSLDELARTAA